MIKKALDLVLAVYRMTKLFPEGEVLIGQLRQTANQVLAELTLNQPKQAIKQIKALLSYLQVAQAQHWLKDVNFAVIIREYNQLLSEIRQVSRKKEVVFTKEEKVKTLNHRQKKILEKVKNLNKFRLGDLKEYFPNLNPRTLIRDLDKLCLNGYLKRQGYGRGSFYRNVTE